MATEGPAPLPAEYLQRYLANLELLYARDPELAGQIDALPFAQTPPLELARDGHPTVRLTADDGKAIYAHSRYRPTEEAATLVTAQARRKAETPEGQPDSQPADTEPEESEPDEELEYPSFLVAGVGLGYHLAELERRFAHPVMVVADDDLGLLKAALCVVDLTAPLRERRLTFLTTADKAAVHERLRSAITHLMLGLRFITLPHTSRYHVGFYRQMRGLMRDFVSYSRVQMMSLLRHARITCHNIAFNLPTYVSQPGIEELEGRAKGYPAILVAAGPSLARNIDQLGPLRDRAVVIAVQTLLKTLLARKIPPHFVTSLDYHQISAQFFHGLTDFGGTILVAEPKATWHVLDAYRGGRVHLLKAEFADELLGEAAPTRAALRAGSTVAHLSFYLAEFLGCDPIILVGQDLSFTDGLYYPPGMQVERIWQPELGRFQTIEMKQWERVVRHRIGLKVVPDVHGRNVYTDDQLFTYAEQFQSDFLQSPARVIHACEGGMRMEGTEVMTLREATERFCTRPLPPKLLDVSAGSPPPDLQKRVCAALEQRIEELNKTREIAVQTKETLDRLVDLVERPTEFNRLVVEIDELRARMHERERIYNLVVLVSQLAQLRRVQADRAIRDDERETPERARRRLKRDREFVTAFIDGCDFLGQILPQVVQRVREQVP